METFQLMLNKSMPSENDFFTFFDMVFYQPFVTDKHFEHVKTYYVSTVLPYLDRCVTKFGADAIVCKYGQAGFYLYKNDLEKVHKDLLYLASRYPSSYVLRAIGQYYEANGDEDKAKAYYLKASSLKNGTVVDVSSLRS